MKKLLILGATYNENVIIERARKKGIYTIVTDNNLDYSLSPAKYLADEAWDISWSDIDTLYLKCKENKIDGVIAGFSEFRIENMIKLCEKLKFPCPITLEQLEITRDKIKFKNLCKEYDIPCVPEYQYGDNISYPVIIKPVDRAGSIGINVVKDPVDFEKSYQYALSLSPSKSVIIEDFIEDGIKFDIYYFVINGKVTLLGTSDTIMCEGTDAAPILQKAWVFPSVYENLYLEELDIKARKMLLGLGIENGYATISAFYRNQQFYFFEAGFRLSGEMSFNYYNAFSGINYVDLLLDFSLGIKLVQTLNDAVKNKEYSVILNFFGKDGYIEDISLPNSVECKSLIATNLYVKRGDKIHNTTNVLNKVAMFTFYSSSQNQLIEDIDYVNTHFCLKNATADLIYEKVDPQSLGFRIITEENGITIMQKPYFISWNEIQRLLNEAHKTNIEKGLIYATYNQSIEELKEKVKNGKCFVAMDGDKIVGTATIQFRNLNYWYHNGPIGLLKLLAIHPAYRGKNIAQKLLDARINCAISQKIKVIVTDSAERNLAIKKLYLNNNFRIVDCCKYKNNNFITIVYAKWLDNCPWSRLNIWFHYVLKRMNINEHQ